MNVSKDARIEPLLSENNKLQSLRFIVDPLFYSSRELLVAWAYWGIGVTKKAKQVVTLGLLSFLID